MMRDPTRSTRSPTPISSIVCHRDPHTHGPAGLAALTHLPPLTPRQGPGSDPDNETFAPKIPPPSLGKHSREEGTQKSLFLRAPLRGRPEQAGTGGVPQAGGATRPSPHSRRRPSAGELAAAACPESPLPGLGHWLPLGQTTILRVRDDSCSPSFRAVLYVFRTFQL